MLRMRLIAISLCLSLISGCIYVGRLPLPRRDLLSSDSKTYRGVMHIHSEYSHDSVASVSSIKKTARKADLDFVILTDHNNLDARRDIQPEQDEPLLIAGQEISSPAGHLMAVGPDRVINRNQSTQEIINEIKSAGGIAVLAHPYCEKSAWRDFSVEGYDGLEIYNFSHDFYPTNKLTLPFKFLFLPPGLFLKFFQRMPGSALRDWDRQLSERKVFAYGGPDAHIHFKVMGFPVESNLLAFESVTLNIPSNELTKTALLESLKAGKHFISFDYLGKARDFKFYATDHSGQRFDMGQTLSSEILNEAKLYVNLPDEAMVRLIHNGNVISEEKTAANSYTDLNEGYYRVEIYKGRKLWVISNPIFVGHEKYA